MLALASILLIWKLYGCMNSCFMYSLIIGFEFQQVSESSIALQHMCQKALGKKNTSLWMCISFLFYFLAEGCAQSWHFCACLCFQKLKFSTVVLLFYARCTRDSSFEKLRRRRTRTRTRAFFYQGRSVIQRQSAKQLPQKWGDSGLTCFFPCLGRPRRLSTSFSSLIRKDTNWFCTPISSTISS